MPDKRLKRKLAAILSADVVGYSRLMSQDEASTINTLTGHKEIMSNLIKGNRGRVVDAPGDNLLAEFASVVDAVECACKIQSILVEKNGKLPEKRRMHFRIGVNIGEVVIEGGRIYGDGVNLAARLESLADSGGVCISGAVYDQVKNKTRFKYDDLGEHSVKNFDKPIQVYKIYCSLRHNEEGEILAEGGEVKQPFTLPDKPSIAIVPFKNISGDADQEYIADGITESIITALSHISELFVTARDSVFSYKGKPVAVNKIGKDLGVRYVLGGSVLKVAERVRITVQLVDTITGHHLWAEKFDRMISDFFDLLDEIAQNVAVALTVKLTHGESAVYGLGTRNFEAWGYYVKAISKFERFSKSDNLKARLYLKKTVKLDPEFAIAWVLFAWTYFIDLRFGFSETPDKSLKIAIELGDKASKINSDLPDVYSFWNTVHLIEGDINQAVKEGINAINSGPSHALSYILLSQAMRFAGKFSEAIFYGEQAVRLSPYCPVWYLLVLAPAYIEAGKYETALSMLKTALVRSRNGEFPLSHVLPQFVIVYSRLNRNENAKSYASQLISLEPGFSAKFYNEALFYKDSKYRNRMIQDLISAGLN